MGVIRHLDHTPNKWFALGFVVGLMALMLFPILFIPLMLLALVGLCLSLYEAWRAK